MSNKDKDASRDALPVHHSIEINEPRRWGCLALLLGLLAVGVNVYVLATVDEMKEDADDHYKDSSTSTSDAQSDTWTELPAQTWPSPDNYDLETATSSDELLLMADAPDAEDWEGGTTLDDALDLAYGHSIVELRFGKFRDKPSGAHYLQFSDPPKAGAPGCDPENYVQIRGNGEHCYSEKWVFESCGTKTSADSEYPDRPIFNIRAVSQASGKLLPKYLKCASAGSVPGSSKICEVVGIDTGDRCKETSWQSFTIVRPSWAKDKSGTPTAIYATAAMKSADTLLGVWDSGGYDRAAIWARDAKPTQERHVAIVADCKLTPTAELLARSMDSIFGEWTWFEDISPGVPGKTLTYSVGYVSTMTTSEQNTWASSISGEVGVTGMFGKSAGSDGGKEAGVEVSGSIAWGSSTSMTESVVEAFSESSKVTTATVIQVPNTPCTDPTTCTSPQSCSNCANPPWTKEFFNLDRGLAPSMWQFQYKIPRTSQNCPMLTGHSRPIHMTPQRSWAPCCLPGYNVHNRFDGMCGLLSNGDESPNQCCETTKEADWLAHHTYCPTWKTDKNAWWAANDKPTALLCVLDNPCHIENQYCPPTAFKAPSAGACCASGVWAENTGATDRATCE
jgi:hypothetical protein